MDIGEKVVEKNLRFVNFFLAVNSFSVPMSNIYVLKMNREKELGKIRSNVKFTMIPKMTSI